MKSASLVKICSNTGLKLTSWRPTCSWRCKCSVTNLSFHTNRTPHFNPFLSFRLRCLVCWIFLWKLHLQCVSKPMCFFDVADPFAFFSLLVMNSCFKIVFSHKINRCNTRWHNKMKTLKDSPVLSAHFKSYGWNWKMYASLKKSFFSPPREFNFWEVGR